MSHKIPLLFDHDGGVDDLLSLLLLTTMPDVELLGVSVTPADCLLSDAVTSTLKLLKWCMPKQVPVAKGNMHGVNPFPHDWRVQPKSCLAMPQMLSIDADETWLSSLPAHEFMAEQLMQAEQPVTVLMTGPCSNLVAALELEPEARANIAKVVWMGGAVRTRGNVVIHNHDGSAEWNAYWDPIATQKLVEMDLDLHLIALDACNRLPVDMDFLKRLAGQRQYALSDLAGQFWATTVGAIPSYEFTYHLWDVLATCYLVLGEKFVETEVLPISVSTDEPNEGQTLLDPQNGRPVTVAVDADGDSILDYLLEQFRQD